ncbi:MULTISPECIES: universal stress protein [unclassified Synechococcus]|jgi:nucleotide-binding universal stress UspA family protein|uniref:universal stress protein n=1 Tax=unclassified Synechococcus TaxID=2626047 RepID=UPI000B983128|nr:MULTISPECIES: universal stress protein [unclassified Synechococcus]MCP9827624.1 universal stress protein [Synechococcus sp. L2F]MCP9847155.1 universal stress protein [Synechococcus sp. Lug-A]MCT0209336.1 universal stress protein [Synechococcus sp. CS-1333]PZV23970.1 MAG: universal stress protein [Cyanobium sp.]
MFQHLLVPTDGSRLSLAAAAAACRFAREAGARLTVLNVRANAPLGLTYGAGEWIQPSTLQEIEDVGREASQRALAEVMSLAAEEGVEAASESVVNDSPSEAILAAADRHGCDLIFMASHGRRGLTGLLIGSQTQRVLAQAKQPVLVFR